MPLLTKFEVTPLWPVRRVAAVALPRLCMFSHEHATAALAWRISACWPAPLSMYSGLMHSLAPACSSSRPTSTQQPSAKREPSRRTTPRTRPTACTAPTLMAACVAPPWLPTPPLTLVRLLCVWGGRSGKQHTWHTTTCATTCPSVEPCAEEICSCSTGSHDPDTAELDSIIPIQPTSAFYSPTLYKLVRAQSCDAASHIYVAWGVHLLLRKHRVRMLPLLRMWRSGRLLSRPADLGRGAVDGVHPDGDGRPRRLQPVQRACRHRGRQPAGLEVDVQPAQCDGAAHQRAQRHQHPVHLAAELQVLLLAGRHLQRQRPGAFPWYCLQQGLSALLSASQSTASVQAVLQSSMCGVRECVSCLISRGAVAADHPAVR